MDKCPDLTGIVPVSRWVAKFRLVYRFVLFVIQCVCTALFIFLKNLWMTPKGMIYTI